MERTALDLTITATSDMTLLLRCLQILARRGYTLTALTTEPRGGDTVHVMCRLQGPTRWHQAVVPLIGRVVGVQRVAPTKQEPNHG